MLKYKIPEERFNKEKYPAPGVEFVESAT